MDVLYSDNAWKEIKFSWPGPIDQFKTPLGRDHFPGYVFLSDYVDIIISSHFQLLTNGVLNFEA